MRLTDVASIAVYESLQSARIDMVRELFGDTVAQDVARRYNCQYKFAFSRRGARRVVKGLPMGTWRKYFCRNCQRWHIHFTGQRLNIAEIAHTVLGARVDALK